MYRHGLETQKCETLPIFKDSTIPTKLRNDILFSNIFLVICLLQIHIQNMQY